MDCSPPGSSVHGIFQARIREQVAVSPRDLPSPENKPTSPALAGRFSTNEPPAKPTPTLLQLKKNVEGDRADVRGLRAQSMLSRVRQQWESRPYYL